MFDRWLNNWVTWIVSIPRATLFVISLITLALGWVAASQFKINSDLTQLIRQEADWRKDFDHFQKEFPQLTRTAVVVLSASSLQKLESGRSPALAIQFNISIGSLCRMRLARSSMRWNPHAHPGRSTRNSRRFHGPIRIRAPPHTAVIGK